MSAAPRERIAAVVVLYGPDAGLPERVATYAGQVGRVFAADNSDTPDEAVLERLRGAGVTVLPMGGNRGIAAALNAGCDAALEAGFEWALTFDDDSEASPDLAERLWTCVADDGGGRVAIAAPVIRIEGGIPEPLSAECIDVESVITSGCLMRLSAYGDLGRFREDLFVDHVDTEFCFRALREGYRVVQRRDAVLTHRIGRLEERRFPFRHFVTNHPPVRRYYQARNALEVARLYGGAHPAWVADQRRQWMRTLPKLVLSEGEKLTKLRRIAQGVRDYRARRFGRYEDLHGSVR